MDGFKLQVITPDGVAFDAVAEGVVVRTTGGDVCILKNHADYLATIGFGRVKIKTKNSTKTAACMGGFVRVSGNVTRIVATTFEYADEIDTERATRAKEAAEKRIAQSKSDDELLLAEMKLKRALNRINVSKDV